MISIFFLACQIANPSSCKEQALSFANPQDGGMTMMQCQMGAAQAALAGWADGNPKYAIRKWRCAPAGMFANL